MKNKEKTLEKVILQFNNEVRTLEGEDVAKWCDMNNSLVSLAYIHGQPCPELNWKITKKKCKK